MRFVLFLALSLLCAPSLMAQKKVKLFNGKDLTGWNIHGTERWYVKDGELVCESGPDKGYGYLSTAQQFKDFDFSVQFRQEANGNSGVFFRSDITGVKIKGWQVEVAPAGKHTGGIYESYGRGWMIKPDSANEQYLKPGKWNTLRIRVQGGTVTTWLNGHQMIQLTDEQIAQANGFIALQIHDGGGIKVRWRKFRLQQL